MTDRTATLTALLVDAVSGPAGKIKHEMSGLGDAAGHVGGGMKAVGSGLLDVAKIATVGIGVLVGGLAVATKAAADEEVGIARLGAALKANVPAFDGNTKAIEKVIASREKLGFSDDDLRSSLGALVVATHDVAKAQALQAEAMDLARAKGISLSDASALLVKVQAGSYRALKTLGIAFAPVTTAQDALKASTDHATDAQVKAAKATDDAATKVAALAAIQAASAGQAAAYGKTAEGAASAFKIALDDLVEDIGSAFLPVVTEAFTFLTATAVPAIREVIGEVQRWFSGTGQLSDGIKSFVSDTLAPLVSKIVGEIVPATVDLVGKFAGFASKLIADVGPSIVGIVGQLGNLFDTIVTKVIPTILDLATRVWEGGLNKAVAAGAKVIASVITVIGDLASAITGNKDAMNILKTAADVIGKAFGVAADAISGTLDFLGDLGDAIRANKPVMDALGAIGNVIATGFKLAADGIRIVIDAITEGIRLAGQLADLVPKIPVYDPGSHFNAPGKNPGGVGGTPVAPPRVAGGPVSEGWFTVGEKGPELLHAGGGGSITPNSGLGGPQTVNLNVTMTNPVQSPKDFLQELQREVQRQGMRLVTA